jgi:hypothetical protein
MRQRVIKKEGGEVENAEERAASVRQSMRLPLYIC